MPAPDRIGITRISQRQPGEKRGRRTHPTFQTTVPAPQSASDLERWQRAISLTLELARAERLEDEVRVLVAVSRQHNLETLPLDKLEMAVVDSLIAAGIIGDRSQIVEHRAVVDSRVAPGEITIRARHTFVGRRFAAPGGRKSRKSKAQPNAQGAAA